MDRSADVLLSDGATVHIRPIRPADADAIVALHGRFSERTRYLRYFSPYPHIPSRDLARFVTVDHRDREALVAELGGRLIAVGRYDRLGPGVDDAEVAFVVEDGHQGRGIGSVLLEHLAAAAAEAGISRFVAEVLPENATMLRVFGDAGYQVRRQYADGVVHLDFAISPTGRSREVQAEREHRAEARSIARLLAPRAVAVYGVSRTGHGVGVALLRHLLAGGYAEPVYPIHPAASTVEGMAAYRSATDLPEPADLAVVAVPAAAVPSVVADAAAGGVHALVVVSAGFAENGAGDPAGVAAQRDVLRAVRAAGMRLVGPNCLGVANTGVRLNVTLVPRLPAAGRVGLFSQSAAFGLALLAEADRRGLGLSTVVSVGNRADVSGNDLLQYWRDDPATDVVLLYLETFGNPRKFARLVRVLGRAKPVVAVASLVRPSGLDPVAVAALFAESGVIRVDTVDEMFDVAVLLARAPLPAGERVAVVTNAGPLGELAAATCARWGLTVAGRARDVGAAAGATEFADALSGALREPGVDSVVVACSPPLPGAPVPPDLAAALDSAAASADKPVVAAFLDGPRPASVPAYPWVEEAVRALGRVAAYARWRRAPAGALPELSDVDDRAGGSAFSAEELLAAYGIEVVPSSTVDDEVAAVAAAEGYGYPVAVKAGRAPLRHRYDLGAVRLDISGAEQVRSAYRDLAARFGPQVLVQPMVAPGVAGVVEVVQDPVFGPVVGFGLGGVASELLGDRAWRAAPLTDRDAEALVAAPRAAPLLSGYRGAAPVDTAALTDLLVRVGLLADAQPRVRRLTLNPVLARPDGYAVLHASVEFGEPMPRPDAGPRRLRDR